MNIGADVEYGKYAMLGARMGCYSTTVNTNEWIQIRELDRMQEFYRNAVMTDHINEDLVVYGESLRKQLDIPVSEMDEWQSRFFKFVMPQNKNVGVQDREYK